MASNDKQQKRAKRAAAKAKQKRIGRNNVAKDRGIELPPIDAFFDKAMESGLCATLFERMDEARDISLTRMCRVFLEDSLVTSVVGSYDEETATDYIFALLAAYHEWMAGPGEDEALAWIQSPDFIEAYQQASERIKADIED